MTRPTVDPKSYVVDAYEVRHAPLCAVCTDPEADCTCEACNVCDGHGRYTDDFGELMAEHAHRMAATDQARVRARERLAAMPNITPQELGEFVADAAREYGVWRQIGGDSREDEGFWKSFRVYLAELVKMAGRNPATIEPDPCLKHTGYGFLHALASRPDLLPCTCGMKDDKG